MAAVLELQQQLQDHGQQLAQLSRQLQNMESLLRSHEEPFTSLKTPRLIGSPPAVSPTERHRAPSCSTEVEIAQARWEALVNMIELEEQARARDVAELRKLLEQASRTQRSNLDENAMCFEASLAKLRSEWEGAFNQIKDKLTKQEEAIKDLASRPSSKEFDDLKAKSDLFATAMDAMSSKLEHGLDTMEVLKGPLLTSVAVPAAAEGNRLSQSLAHAKSQDALGESAQHRRTNSSSPISRNAYARLSPGKSHTISVMPDARTPVLPQKVPSLVTPLVPGLGLGRLAREGTTGSLPDTKVERPTPEPPRIMAAARLSPAMTYRAVQTPVKGKDFTPFVVPPTPPQARFVSPAPFTSRQMKESELILRTPNAKIRSL
ncbi:Pheophorbide a oxygenase [Durusdinium trenchii]|uniref:Chloroplastic n=1 Tax=Durusdinium trenchii TaxID=1381693 RepID=A0ABP0K7Y8_9DINO